MAKASKILFFTFLAATITVVASAQQRKNGVFYTDPAFTLDHWTVEDGLPVNSVNQVIQTPDGYLWLATFDGLVRFDGVRFQVYKSSGYPGLPGNRMQRLTYSSDGAIWIQLENDRLVKFYNGQFRLMEPDDGLNGDRIYCFYKPENSDDLLFCSSGGITVYRNGELSPYRPEIFTHPVTYIYINNEGVTWYKDGSDLSLYRLEGTRKTKLGSASYLTETTPVLTAKNGATLFSLKGIHRYKNGRTQTLQTKLSGLFVTDFYEGNLRFKDFEEGDILAATLRNGLLKIRGDSISVLIPEFRGSELGNFLEAGGALWLMGNKSIYRNGKQVFSFEDKIRQILYDREGSFWFGSESAGLFRLKPSRFTVIGEEEGLPNRNIYPVFQVSDSTFWIGTHGNGVVRYKNGVLGNYTVWPNGGFVRSFTELRNGEMLASFLDKGIYRYNTALDKFEPTSTPPSQPDLVRVFSIDALFEDSSHRLWAGSTHGLFWKEAGTWNKVPEELSNAEYAVRYIVEAPDSSLWMATAGQGLLHLKKNTFTMYSANNGLASNRIRSLFVDTLSVSSESDYLLWVGTEDKGLNRVPVREGIPQMDNIVSYNQQNGLYDNVIHQILSDDFDRFWMSTNRGIFWVSRDQLNRFARGEITTIYSASYTERDGLRNREANGGVFPAGIRALDGKLWFPTQNGLAGINPADIIRDELPTPVHIEEINSDEGQPITPQNGLLTLKPRQRNFEINYTGLSYIAPEKVRFRYRLKGFNEQWIDAGTRRTAFYTNVPAGSYTFEVQIASNGEFWSESPATLPIVVQPYFYERAIFYIFLGLMLVLLGIAFVHRRTQHLEKRQKELENSVRERTKEISLQKEIIEHQAKAQQRFFTNISHELRTPLTLTIGPLEDLKAGENGLQESAVSKVSLALRNARRLLLLVSEILDISRLEASENKLLVSKHDLGQFLKAIAQNFVSLAYRKNINYTINVPYAVEAWFSQDHIEKVITNLLSNAFKFTEDNHDISVSLSKKGSEAVIEVCDTGMGIPKNELPFIFDRFYQSSNSSSRLQHGTGIGLALVKHLAELHGGAISAESTLGKGTTFTLTLPLNAHELPHAEIEKNRYPRMAAFPAMVDGENISALENNSALEHEDQTTVLVVEDNRELRQFVADHLRAHYRVIEAVDGKDGLEKARSYLPDLVVSDVMMPEMDGFEFVKCLRADPAINFIPVILLTGKDTKKDTISGLEHGANDYVVKPFAMDELKARLRSLLRAQKLLRIKLEENKHIISLKNEALKSADQEFIEKVHRAIQEHLSEPTLSVEKLASLVAVGRTTLHRKLTKIANESPVQLIRRCRLERAKYMIESKSGTISEIAYSVGFESISWFSKCFKEQYHISPSELIS